MLKSKIRQLKQKDTKKVKHHSDESLNNSAAPSPMEVLSPPDGAENKEDGVTLEMSQEGQQAAEVKKKRKVSKKKEDTKDEGEKVRNHFVLVRASLYNVYLVMVFLLWSRLLELWISIASGIRQNFIRSTEDVIEIRPSDQMVYK